MWHSSIQPRLMSSPVTIPMPMMASTKASTSFALPGSSIHDVMMRLPNLQTDLTSMSGTITRVIGYLLVITTSGLQLPHIFKVLRSRRCDGISLLSVCILLHSTSANVAYCINRNFPLSMWAESMPLMAQYVTLMCLLLLYSGRERCMLVFVTIFVLVMLPQLLGVVPGHALFIFKILTLPLTLVGKVDNLYQTYKRGDNGQLSKASIVLLNIRSVGRLMTSLFDTRDTILVVCYAHACFWNSLITCQTVYYSHRRRRRMKEERKRREREDAAAAAMLSESSSDSDNTDSEIYPDHSPRRRRYNNLTVPNNSTTQ